MNARHRLTRLLALATLLALSLAASAQTPSPRIRGPIESAPSVTLRGSLNPHVGTATDLGALAPDTLIPGITLVFSRSAQQQKDLDQLLAQQTDPSSPLFHHWLTPAGFAARFAPAPADIATTQAWLRSHGFTIDSVGADRITFSGTAAQVHQAFGAELHHFLSPARQGKPAELHFAPNADLLIPPALAPVTAAVLHLSDFRPKPNVRPRPNYTTISGQQHYLSPDDILTMYDLWPLSGHSYGSFQSVAIVGQSYVPTGPESEVLRFSSVNTSTGISLSPVLVPGSGVEAIFPGDEGESEIDIEYSSGVSRGANLYFVFTGANSNYDVNDAIALAITHDIARVISVSYSECEPLESSSNLQQFNSLFQQAAAQGQTIIAASGDQGPTACVVYGSNSGLTTAQQQGLAVNFPASSPWVTAVGGTQMAPGTFAPGSSTYWNSATNYDSIGSLVGYTPEVVWNEDSPTQGIFASSGGPSTLFARPSWQTGVPGIPAGSFRLVPDISFQASAANPGYIICSDDPYLGGDSSDCASSLALENSSGHYVINGGTSFAAPIFAGFVAFLNGYEQSNGQGNVNPILYSLAAQPSIYASTFHDVTIGTTACLSADSNCSTAGQSNFAATPGYDQATGLGSVDFAKLIAAWPVDPSKNLIQTVLFANLPLTADPGESLNISVQVDESSPTGAPGPTGSISLIVDGAAPVSLPITTSGTSAMATYSVNVPSATGSHTLSFIYPGDATHAGSTTTDSVMVGSAVATGTVTLSATDLTLSNNTTGSGQVTVTPSGGYNGFLNWTMSVTGGTVETTYCYLIDLPPISGTTSGTLHLGVNTACNSPSALESRGTTQRASTKLAPRPRAARIPTAAVLAFLLCAVFPSRRRKLLPLLAVLVFAVVPFALSGCGGGSGSGSGGGGGGGAGGSQAQTYTVTITAKDSVQTSITASTSFTLTVD